MNVLIITCVYKPEPVVSSGIAYDLAVELCKLNYQVTVLCPFPSRPKGQIYDGFKRNLCKTEVDDTGFSIVRVLSFFSKKSSFLSRFLENVSFGITSTLYLCFSKQKPDVIFLNTWPIFASFLNIFTAKLLGVRVVRSIQDIYPETLSSQKRILKGGLFYKLLSCFERYNYSNSWKNITISQIMGNVLADRYPQLPQPIIVPNWHTIPQRSKNEMSRAQISSKIVSGDTVFLYGGNISTASNIVGLLQAFATFSIGQPVAKLIIAGSGPLYQTCAELVQNLNMEDKVFFHNPWRAQDTLSLLTLADILILPTDNEQAIYSVPSKIISYMTASRPILAFGVTNSELEDLVCLSGCGWFYDGVDELTIHAGLKASLNSSLLGRQSMGTRGYKFMVDNLSKDVNLQKIIDQLIG